METTTSILLHPVTIAVIAFILLLICMLLPYEIQFEEKEESDN